MKCGMSEVQITPWLGNWMPGSLHGRKSEGVLDELHAKAVVIETLDMTMAIIVVDSLDLQRYMVEAIRRRVNEHTDIPESGIMVSATHSHTAGPVRAGFGGEKNDEYNEFLVKKAADAAIMAYQQRKEARMGFGRGYEEDISFNRRYHMKDGIVRTNPGVGNPDIDRPEGPIDPEVLVVRIDDIAGKPIGVISNFALHLDTVDGTEYSADYAGEISRHVKNVLGPDCVSLFMLGACGNINHIDVSGYIPFIPKHHIFLGQILAAEILKVHGKIKTGDHDECQVDQTIFSLKLRMPSQEQLSWSQNILASGAGDEMEQAMAKQINKLVLMKDNPNRYIELQVIILGEMAIVGVPGELFVEFGLKIKELSSFRYTLINELCNDSGGYICTEEAHKNGGYEPHLTSTSRWPIETGTTVVAHVKEMLNQLRK